MIIYTIDEILQINNPTQLFPNDKIKAKQIKNDLLKKYHPDLHGGDEKYSRVTSKINELYLQAIESIEKGLWIDENLIKLKGVDGKTYSMSFNKEYDFELGKFYIGNKSILYLIEKDFEDLVDNALKRINSLNYANEDMRNEFEKYLPKILKKIETIEGKICLLIEKTEDVYCLKDILNYYNGKIPAKHVAWILSSIYNILCFLDFNKISHNGISIENYFISPKFHSGLLLGGWWYAVPYKEKMIGTTSEIYDIMPPDIQDTKIASCSVDLESVKLLGRILLGDKVGHSFINDSNIPEPFSNWVRGVSCDDSLKEYKLWTKALISSFGERKFVEMNIDKNLIYKKN